MKEPMLTLVENAIGASFGPSAEAIPAREFNAAVKVAALAALLALRKPTEEMIEAADRVRNATFSGDGRSDLTISRWEAMIDSAMQGA